MALTRCPHCRGTRYEIVEQTPDKSNFVLQFVQCATCGAPVSVLENYNISWLVKRLAEKLGINLN